jgi:hypothetical protein
VEQLKDLKKKKVGDDTATKKFLDEELRKKLMQEGER